MTTAKKTAAAKKTASSSTAATSSNTPTAEPTSAGATDETKTDETTPPAPDADVTQDDGSGATGNGQDENGELGSTNSPLIQNSGPGTSDPVAPGDETFRPPATIVNSDPVAAPLDGPADTPGQTQPVLGHPDSSTSQTYAENGGRTIAGENHQRLVDEDGNTLNPDEIFDGWDQAKTFVTARQRIYEEFTYPRTSTPTKRLMFAAGRRVPRWQADKIVAAAQADYAAANPSDGEASE